MPSDRSPFPVLFDPAWLYLLSGLTLLFATVYVSSQRDVDDARFIRDQTIAVENHRQERLARYEEFLAAVDQGQPALIEALASSQLNKIPASRAAIPGTVDDNTRDASVFPALEPLPLTLPDRTSVDSTLTRLVNNDATRLWLMAGSVVLILVGLLPASRGTMGSRAYLERNHGLLTRE